MPKAKKDLLPVYLIVGDDHLRRRAVLKRLNERMSEYGDMSFNSSSFDGAEATGDEIVNACNTMPFAADKRYVLVNKTESLNKDDSETLVAYLGNPSNTCVLALVADKLAKNTRLYKAISKIDSTCIISCETPKAYELKDKLVAIARSHKGSIEPNAVQALIDYVGTDTTHLDNEIKKLLLTTQDNNITLQHVVNNVGKSSSAKPWDFTYAYSSRNIKAALNTFYSMDDKAAFILLPMVCKRIRELICVQNMSGSVTANSIANKLKLAPWQCKNHNNWARNFTEDQLRNNLEEALNCEADIKSGADPTTRFELFIITTLS